MADCCYYDEQRDVLAMKAGDEEAFGWITERYTPYVGAVVHAITGQRLGQAEKEELVVDVFYALWVNAAMVRPEKLKAYLAAIAHSKARNALRREQAELPLEDGLLLLSPSDPEKELTKAEEARMLRRCLDELPEPDRSIHEKKAIGKFRWPF